MTTISRGNISLRFGTALAVILVAAGLLFGQTSNTSFSNIKIKNFGQMNERFYRGSQPKESDYKDLATLGIKTLIDLRDDPEPSEKRDAEALGMRYVNIPMSDKEYPHPDQIAAFLNLLDQPPPRKFHSYSP